MFEEQQEGGVRRNVKRREEQCSRKPLWLVLWRRESARASAQNKEIQFQCSGGKELGGSGSRNEWGRA